MCSKQCPIHDECVEKGIKKDISKIKKILHEDPNLCKFMIEVGIKMKSIQRWNWFIVCLLMANLASISTGIILMFYKLMPAIIKLLESNHG